MLIVYRNWKEADDHEGETDVFFTFVLAKMMEDVPIEDYIAQLITVAASDPDISDRASTMMEVGAIMSFFTAYPEELLFVVMPDDSDEVHYYVQCSDGTFDRIGIFHE